MDESCILKFYIIANMAGSGTLQKGLSGGDRIAVECIKHWKNEGINVVVMTSKSGRLTYGLKDMNYIMIQAPSFWKHSILGTLIFALVALVKGLVKALSLRDLKDTTMLYSASEFLPDLLPTLVIRLRNKNTKWIAAFYLFAPHPFSSESPYHGFSKIKNILYFAMQQISYRIVKRHADMVWVTNELDRWRFIDNRRLTPDRVIAARGGVDIETPALVSEPKEKKFEAVFIGRFHPQKGVLELIDIWRLVCKKRPNAKLAMIGVGPLEGDVEEKIKKHGLENNVVLFGFKDGVEKLKIFKESRMALYPATLDHWSMAPVEAMACVLPLVTFDFSTLRVLQPKGMVKVPCYDLNSFAEGILSLLEDVKLYDKLREEALDFASEWDWNKRADSLLRSAMSLLSTSEDGGLK